MQKNEVFRWSAICNDNDFASDLTEPTFPDGSEVLVINYASMRCVGRNRKREDNQIDVKSSMISPVVTINFGKKSDDIVNYPYHIYCPVKRILTESDETSFTWIGECQMTFKIIRGEVIEVAVSAPFLSPSNQLFVQCQMFICGLYH